MVLLLIFQGYESGNHALLLFLFFSVYQAHETPQNPSWPAPVSSDDQGNETRDMQCNTSFCKKYCWSGSGDQFIETPDDVDKVHHCFKRQADERKTIFNVHDIHPGDLFILKLLCTVSRMSRVDSMVLCWISRSSDMFLLHRQLYFLVCVCVCVCLFVCLLNCFLVLISCCPMMVKLKLLSSALISSR